QQGVLAKPGLGVLHLRLPPDVPGDLHRTLGKWHRRGRAGGRHQAIDVLRRGDVGVGRDPGGDHENRQRRGGVIKQTTYYVAPMSAFAVIPAAYTNIAIGVVFQRDAGILKRTKGTPLPGGAYLGGRVLHVLIIAVLLVVITAAFGVAFYNADVPTGTLLLGYLIVVVGGAVVFARLGMATTAIVPNADAAPPVVNAIILPLLFLSGIFIPFGVETPEWIKT